MPAVGAALLVATIACGKPPPPEVPHHVDGTICGVPAHGPTRTCSALGDKQANYARVWSGQYRCPDSILYFDHGSIALPPNAPAVLAQIAEEMERTRVALVEVVSLGVRGEDAEIARRRAAAVIDALVRDQGISVVRLVAVQGTFAPSPGDEFDFKLGLPHVSLRAARCLDEALVE